MRGPVFPDTLLSSLGFTKKTLEILYCCGKVETVSQFMVLPCREYIPSAWSDELEEISSLREDIKRRLRERTEEEIKRPALVDIWRTAHPEHAENRKRTMGPDASIREVVSFDLDGSVFNSLSGYGVEKVSQLMRLDEAGEIPGVGPEEWEIVRFLRMAAACRMEETGD